MCHIISWCADAQFLFFFFVVVVGFCYSSVFQMLEPAYQSTKRLDDKLLLSFPTRLLYNISERDMEVLQLFQRLGGIWMHLAAIPVLLLDGVPPLILPRHDPNQHGGAEDAVDLETKQDGMALEKHGRLVVDVRAQNGEALAEDFGPSPSGAALGEAGNVHAQPRKQQDDRRVEEGGDQARREHFRFVVRNGHQNDIADAGAAQGEDEIRALGVVPVGDGADGQGHHQRTCVGNDGEQECFFCWRVSQPSSVRCVH